MFHCQRDSYCRQLETKVTSCKPSKRKGINGSKKEVSGFDVVFEDTVLFPEGGGQNTDKGTVDGLEVLHVIRDGPVAIHFMTESLKEGATVTQIVDWRRRFDNMQQHTGQHLISAILEKQYANDTKSWWMAENGEKVGISYIELDKPIDHATMVEVEATCNEAIQKAVPVTVLTYEMGDPGLDKGKTRGLPADHTGTIRLINIAELDDNLCCGTHVSNLSHLQTIKLLHTESQKGKTLLYFLVGSRVLNYLTNAIDREKKLTAVLRNGPEDHLDLVEKMQKSLKIYQKTTQNLLKEIAASEAATLKSKQPKPAYFVCHKREGDADFINTFIAELDDNEILLVLSTGDEKATTGQLALSGNPELVSALGKKLCTLLEGKGGGKGSRFNAKFSAIKKVTQIENVVKEHFEKIE